MKKIAELFKSIKLKHILVPLLLGTVTIFLIYTPEGLLGKADAIGYAVCHRIPSRSFFIGERQLPLCVRCTGMHLGAFIGFIYQLKYKKHGNMPSKKFIVILGLLFIAFALDGLNSYLHLFPKAPGVYEPQNWLRLLTGVGLGIGISAVLFPTFNQTVWRDWVEESSLQSWRQVAELLIISIIFYFLTLSENLLVLYPVALITSFNIILILATIYTIIWILIFKRENTFNSIIDLKYFFMMGIICSFVQILLMDLARYNITGTWEGFF